MGKMHKARKRRMDYLQSKVTLRGREHREKCSLSNYYFRILWRISGLIPSERAYDFQLTLCSCRLVITSVYVGVLVCTNLSKEQRNWKQFHLPATGVKPRQGSPELVVKSRGFSDFEEDLYCKVGMRDKQKASFKFIVFLSVSSQV